MEISDKFSQILLEPDLQTQLEKIDALTELETKEMLKAYVRFLKRDQPPQI